MAIDLFVRSGTGSLVSDLADQRARDEKKIVQGPHAGADAARFLAGKLKQFSSDLATCRGRNISHNALELKEAINRCKENPLIPQLGPLLDRLAIEVQHFDGNEIGDGLKAARWCLDHGLIQQGYTILRELIVTEAARHMSVPPVEPESYRRGVDHAIGTDVGILRSSREKPRQLETDALKLLHFNDTPDLVRLFDEIGDPRNDLNHAGMRPNPRAAGVFSALLPDLIQRFAKLEAQK